MSRALLGCVALWALLQSARAFTESVKCAVCETQPPSGPIDDCCCSAETVSHATRSHFRPVLDALVHTKFFRYFKVDMASDCPFWREDFQCAQQECAVRDCRREEVPPAFLQQDTEERLETGVSPCGPMGLQAAPVPGETRASVQELSRLEHGAQPRGSHPSMSWDAHSSRPAWLHQHSPEERLTYVDLLANPERYTGYQGQRIWRAIYDENCFGPGYGAEGLDDGMCLEERVFYRVISGLHASINTHIARDFKFSDGTWGENVPLYLDRVGKHRGRIENLYFAFLVVARAVHKAKDLLLHYPLTTGDAAEDRRAAQLLEQLLDLSTTQCQQVAAGFNESRMFKVEPVGLSPLEYQLRLRQTMQLQEQFRQRFHNMSRILDCVGCDKCKVWGKLQVLGIGTAMKILFADNPERDLSLQRNDVIALINVFDRLARSVETVHSMREQEFQLRMARYNEAAAWVAASGATVGLLLLLRRRRAMSRGAGARDKLD